MTLVVDGMSVAEGALDPPEIHMALHRTPATTALYEVLGDDPACIRTNKDEVCLIALTEETTPAYLEETGRMMTHQFDETFQRQYTLIDEFEHRDE